MGRGGVRQHHATHPLSGAIGRVAVQLVDLRGLAAAASAPGSPGRGSNKRGQRRRHAHDLGLCQAEMRANTTTVQVIQILDKGKVSNPLFCKSDQNSAAFV
jgi:hypothetical protein